MGGSNQSKERNPSSSPASNSKQSEKENPNSAAKRSSEAMIFEYLTRELPGRTVRPETAMTLAFVLEYFAVRILKGSTHVARNRAHSQGAALKVTVADVSEAIESDNELKEFLERVRRVNDNKN